MQVVYVGPDALGVEIAATGQWAPTGVPVEVDDELGAQLCEQPIWEPATPADAPVPPADKE